MREDEEEGLPAPVGPHRTSTLPCAMCLLQFTVWTLRSPTSLILESMVSYSIIYIRTVIYCGITVICCGIL